MTGRVVVLLGGQRRLGHQRSHPRFVDRFADDRQLLVDHCKLLTGSDQAGMSVADSSFQQRSMHGSSSVGGRKPMTPRLQAVKDSLIRRAADAGFLWHPDPPVDDGRIATGIHFQIVSRVVEVAHEPGRVHAQAGGQNQVGGPPEARLEKAPDEDRHAGGRHTRHEPPTRHAAPRAGPV